MRPMILLWAALLLCSCVPDQPAATTAPDVAAVTAFHPLVPALPPEAARPPAPTPDAVWTPASYEWNGRSYDLVPGSWTTQAAPTAIWQPGHWIPAANGRYQWIKGQWLDM